jgi:hypothetical protein
MDQRTTAIVDGYVAVLNDVLRILVVKQLLTKTELRTSLSEMLKRDIERGAQPGFDEVPIFLLRSIEGWDDQLAKH